MRCSNRTWLTLVGIATLGVVAVLFLAVTFRLFALQRFAPAKVDPAMAQAGRDLFHHEWTADDPLSPDGDGLGPVFNATSCVACHNQGGAGGDGSRANNVTTFSVQLPGQQPRHGVIHAAATGKEFQETLRDVHPQLPDVARPQLDQLDLLAGIAKPRNKLDLRWKRPADGNEIRMPAGVVVSQFNTPALFGAGWIDAIPDHVLVAVEQSQRAKQGRKQAGTAKQKKFASGNMEPSDFPIGRVSRLPDGRIGKFGWKGQTATLSEFVQAACANELGLGNPNHPQPASLRRPNYKPRGLDLSQKQCDQITAFVASLDKPTERLPAVGPAHAAAVAGKRLFGAIGCAHCHTPDLGSIEGIYSDLLLHRMDSQMAGSGGYNERREPVPTTDPNASPDPSEWRTPPLWGVADSAPYMHDGRADTLEEAIQLHGGQGKLAASSFGQLSKGEQGQVIAFLERLQAP